MASSAPRVTSRVQQRTARLADEILQQGVFFLDIRRGFLLPLFLQSCRDDGVDEFADDAHPSVHLVPPKLDEWPEGTIMKPP